jgi:hypothetical protein
MKKKRKIIVSYKGYAYSSAVLAIELLLFSVILVKLEFSENQHKGGFPSVKDT